MTKTTKAETTSTAIEAAPKKKTTRSRKKTEVEVQANPTENSEKEKEVETATAEAEKPKIRKTARTRKQAKAAEPVETKVEEQPGTAIAPEPEVKEVLEVKKKAKDVPEIKKEIKEPPVEKKTKPVVAAAAKPREIAANIVVNDFCDLVNQGGRIPLLNEQQIQQLSYEEVLQRSATLERILRQVLDYDIVLSDTNIWLELQVGHSSSHSDPKVNARLQFERQLEHISKMMKRIGGRFMIMSETYEEVDRFASALDPVSYKDADWSDEALCRNVSARLAKKLMLAQQKENRLRIEGIGSESHHAAFADPAIIRRTVEFFAEGKKVLLLTNDASVGIRSLGMCDDLQRHNNIDDQTWRTVYEPQRPMVLTMDDLKVLDLYSRQYYFLQVASGRQWMQDVSERKSITLETPLQLWLDGFRPGDRHERKSDRMAEQQRKEQQRKEQAQREAEKRAEQERREQQRKADKEKTAIATRNKTEEAKTDVSEQEKTTKPDTDKNAEVPMQEAETANPVRTAETAVEDKPKSSRRGGRGRRGGKSKNA